MIVTADQLRQWLRGKEGEHLEFKEFKEAKNNFHFEKLVKYCAALANEGGGSIVLGVTDKPPRKVVGSNVFPDLNRAKAGLVDKLRRRGCLLDARRRESRPDDGGHAATDLRGGSPRLLR